MLDFNHLLTTQTIDCLLKCLSFNWFLHFSEWGSSYIMNQTWKSFRLKSCIIELSLCISRCCFSCGVQSISKICLHSKVVWPCCCFPDNDVNCLAHFNSHMIPKAVHLFRKPAAGLQQPERQFHKEKNKQRRASMFQKSSKNRSVREKAAEEECSALGFVFLTLWRRLL